MDIWRLAGVQMNAARIFSTIGMRYNIQLLAFILSLSIYANMQRGSPVSHSLPLVVKERRRKIKGKTGAEANRNTNNGGAQK